MPALKVIGNFTTRPFASDDMQIVCLISGVYRLLQLVCLVPLSILFYLRFVKGVNLRVDGVPSWCDQYPLYNFTYESGNLPYFKEDIDYEYTVGSSNDIFVPNAITYFFIDVAWMSMVWSSASIGTPTEPFRRDKYIRNLILLKMIGGVYPLFLLGFGIYFIHGFRKNNYGCSDGEATFGPEDTAYYGLLCVLLVTYAIELLVWPAIITNKLIRVLKKNRFWGRALVGKAKRFERILGCALKMLLCITRGKVGGKELKNKGELKDFAYHVMGLFNNETKLDLVLSDIYVGMRVLSLIQAERTVEAIKKMSNQKKLLQWKEGRESNSQEQRAERLTTDNPDGGQLPESDLALKGGRRPSLLVLQMKQNGYEICERAVLQETNAFDQNTMSAGAHFVQYASKIYVEIPNCVIEEFAQGEDECSGFTRELDTLFCDDFRLSSIGLEYANLCYANFVNGIIATPYAVLVDKQMEKIVIVVRGTRSLEDLVVDLQFIPESLEKVGQVCGFYGHNHFCHKGFLARSKWMYNDIKKTKVLKTLYSEQSPFKDYPLILCGHSLGAGCASILSLMLSSSFPSLRCFAYEPPGCIFDGEMSRQCEEFVTSYVRHDDLVPRLSYHNFETLRDEFFKAFARIKVSKIQLYFHWKTPYSARFVAARNAKVLRPQERIPTDTKFHERLELFRAEREEKNQTSVNKVQLFIPGKIVHLVDTNGDGNYVSYWAGRAEFNHLEISKRMYADHDIHSLVKILKELYLGQANRITVAFPNAPLIYVDDEDGVDADVRLFACWSNPYGKLPIVLWLLGLIASSLSTAAGTGCDFVQADFSSNRTFNGTVTMKFGIYSYGLQDCVNLTGSCVNIEDYLEKCVPYPPQIKTDGYLEASQVFHILATIFGSIATAMIFISICFIIRQNTWKIITVILLLTWLLEGLIFIFFQEFSFCSESTCTGGTGATQVITACCCWFLMSIGSGYLAKFGKKSEKVVR